VDLPTEPIELTLGDMQLICSPRRELSIGMLKVQKIKSLFFFGSSGCTAQKKVTESLGKGRYAINAKMMKNLTYVMNFLSSKFF
jgi:hypothetical protein